MPPSQAKASEHCILVDQRHLIPVFRVTRSPWTRPPWQIKVPWTLFFVNTMYKNLLEKQRNVPAIMTPRIRPRIWTRIRPFPSKTGVDVSLRKRPIRKSTSATWFHAFLLKLQSNWVWLECVRTAVYILVIKSYNFCNFLFRVKVTTILILSLSAFVNFHYRMECWNALGCSFL